MPDTIAETLTAEDLASRLHAILTDAAHADLPSPILMRINPDDQEISFLIHGVTDYTAWLLRYDQFIPAPEWISAHKMHRYCARTNVAGATLELLLYTQEEL